MYTNEIRNNIQERCMKNLDCFQACMQLVGQGNPLLVYLPKLICWTFWFEGAQTLLGGRIQANPKIFINDFYKKYLKIPVVFIKDDKEQMELAIQEALRLEKKVIIGTDVFYCCWNKGYKKSHLNHFLIVKEWSKETRRYCCSDPYFNEESFYVEANQLIQMCFNVRIITLDKEPIKYALKEQELFQLLLSNYTSADELYEQYAAFSKALKCVKEREEIFENEDVSLCQIIYKLKNISGNRLSLAYVLLEYEENHPEFSAKGLYQSFYRMWEGWQALNIRLMRAHIKKKEIEWRDSLSELILAQGKLESAVWGEIRNLYN